MARGIALLVGVGDFWCERDVDRMVKILSSADEYTINILKSELATAEAILACINSAARSLGPGDLFVFYFAGHGDRQKDVNGDEADQMDEVLVTYSSRIVDDELAECWKRFAADVRIVMLSDSCYSGTNAWLLAEGLDRPPAKELKPFSFTGYIPGLKAQMIHIGACGDDEEAPASIFTKTLEEVWKKNKGNFSGYEQLHEAIMARLKAFPEKKYPLPQFNKLGDVKDSFLNSRPFSL